MRQSLLGQGLLITAKLNPVVVIDTVVAMHVRTGRWLILRDTGLTEDGAELVCRASHGFAALETLDLSFNPLTQLDTDTPDSHTQSAAVMVARHSAEPAATRASQTAKS